MFPQTVILTAFLAAASGLPTRQQRLSQAEWGSYSFRDHKGPGTYAFGYDIEDPVSNNVQFRQEERHRNGSVTGSYGYVEPNGHVRIMHYIADHLGYRVREESQPPVHLHPHHEAPITTTNVPPVHEHDEPIFEGEFYPTAEHLNEIDIQADEFQDIQSNPHPIQFPTKVIHPPVYDEGFERPHLQFSNDVTFRLGPPSSRRLNLVPQRVAPTLVYADPWGQYRGSIKVKV